MLIRENLNSLKPKGHVHSSGRNLNCLSGWDPQSFIGCFGGVDADVLDEFLC
jgi:hypothetical protein